MSVLNLKLSLRCRPISGEPLYYELNGAGGIWETVTYDNLDKVRDEIAAKATALLVRSGKDRYLIDAPRYLAHLVM